MKLRDLYRINSRKSLLFSILVHLIILVGITTATIELTTPDGFVSDGEIDLTTSGPGAITPVEIAPPVPTSPALPPKTLPAPKVTKAPPEPTEEKIEEQNVDDTAGIPMKEAKKTWVPVEETDVDDTAGGSIPKDDPPKPIAKTETPPGNNETDNKPDTENDNNSETDETASQSPSTDDTEQNGEAAGPIHSEKELKAKPGNSVNYPLMARIQRIEGTVVLRFTLKDSGDVEKVWLHQSSGSKILDDAAVKAQAQWKYEQGIDGVIQKKMIFSLKGPVTTMPFRNK